jgi:hypothetical protein
MKTAPEHPLNRWLRDDEPLPWQPRWKPQLRQHFFCRRHHGWGAAVCWYEWCHFPGDWGINWGIACKTMQEARTLRRFLNSRVARPGRHGGVPFADVVYAITGNRVRC